MENYSFSKKYHVEYVNLKNDLYNKSNLDKNPDVFIGKSRFILVNIVRNEDDTLIYSYKQKNEFIKPCNKFLYINNQDWWIGSKDIENKILINIDTEEVYDESIHINILCDKKEIFKWHDIEVSPDGKTLLVRGYNILTKSVSCKFRLFDISNLFLYGLQEINLIGDNTLSEFDKDSQLITYKFNDNKSIVKLKWDYVNNCFAMTEEIIVFKDCW